jgi:hypothetical protein
MECGETDVGHFLFAKNEALIGRGIVRLRDTGSGHRGCGCTTNQRKTQSGGTECHHCGGFGCALLLRRLLQSWHGRILRIREIAFDPCLGDFYAAVGSHATVRNLTNALLYVQFVQLDE